MKITLEQIYAAGKLAELHDITDRLDIDEFDGTIRALEAVVHASQELALDSRADRERLITRLITAIGAVPERGKAIIYDAEQAAS